MATAEEILRQYNDAYKSSEAVSRWMPPDAAEYIVRMGEPAVRVYKDKNNGMAETPLIAVACDMVAGDYDGRSFRLGAWTPKTFGNLKGILQDHFGETPDSLEEAVEALKKYTGVLLAVEVKTVQTPKGVFTNANILRVEG